MNNENHIQCANDSYEIIHQEGRGNYGVVYKARRLSDNRIVAIKMPADKDSSNNLYSTQQVEKTISKVKGEIEFLKTIATEAEAHHIIPLWDWHDGSDDHYPMMVMPLCHGTLSNYCRNPGEDHPFDCKQWLGFIEQILIALSFMRQTNTSSIHRDVKIDNLLMLGKKVYLSDFGTFKELKRIGTASLAGSIAWGAPEQFIPEKIESGEPSYQLTDKADIYPVGLIMYMLLTYRGTYPKAQSKLETLIDAGGRCLPNAPQQFQKIGGIDENEKSNCMKYLTQLTQKNDLPFPQEFSNGCMQFLEKLLNPVIDKRPDAKSALKQLKHLQEMIYPTITQLKVTCQTDRIPIGTPIVFDVHAQGKGLPSIDKWLSIYEKQSNKALAFQSRVLKDSYQLKLPGMKQEGSYTFSIQTYDSNISKTCNIKIYATPPILWKQKRYEEALQHETDKNYPAWLKSIEQQASMSKEACQNWLDILDSVHQKILIKNRPDLFVLIARLIVMKDRPLDTQIIAPAKNKEKSAGFFSWMRSGKNEKVRKKSNTEILIPAQKINHRQFNDGDVIRLRSKPKTLSSDDMKAMIKKYNFSDSSVNKSGQFKNKYVDNHDLTVTDGRTGLMWQKGGSDNYMVMKKINDYISGLNKQKFAGYSDWRLPTLEELMSLMENKQMNGNLYIDPVFNKKQRWCWTSDKRSSSSSWVVDFYNGSVRWNGMDSDYYVRAVRFGQ